MPESLLVEAIETATWAPNSDNAQNWRFFIILDKKIILEIAGIIQAEMKTIKSWPEMANAQHVGVRMENLKPGNPLVTAPALIVVAAVRSSNLMHVAIAKRANSDPKAKQIFEGLQIVADWAQTTSAAVAYLMLVLHQMGLGTLWMSGPLHAKAEIEKFLKIPAEMDVVHLIPVGYPAENPTRKRKPVTEVCQVIK